SLRHCVPSRMIIHHANKLFYMGITYRISGRHASPGGSEGTGLGGEKRRSGIANESRQMLVEKAQCAFLRKLVGRLIEGPALIATEAVAGTLVDVQFDSGLCSLDRLNVRHGDGSILVAKVHLHGDADGKVFRLGDSAAIPARRCAQTIELRCSLPRQSTAPAIPDNSDGSVAKVLDGGINVLQRVLWADL